jgi:hypothetical protein
VRTGRWMWTDKMTLALCIGGFPLLVLIFDRLAIGPFPGGLIGCVVAALAASCATFIFEQVVVSVKRIEIDEHGVKFKYLLRTEQGLWNELHASTRPPSHGEWYILRDRNQAQGQMPRSHRLSREQARALLTYRYCPKWDLPEALLKWIQPPG